MFPPTPEHLHVESKTEDLYDFNLALNFSSGSSISLPLRDPAFSPDNQQPPRQQETVVGTYLMVTWSGPLAG